MRAIKGVKIANGFAKLYLPGFMGKIPAKDIHVELW
jgi:hypothetical protein